MTIYFTSFLSLLVKKTQFYSFGHKLRFAVQFSSQFLALSNVWSMQSMVAGPVRLEAFWSHYPVFELRAKKFAQLNDSESFAGRSWGDEFRGFPGIRDTGGDIFKWHMPVCKLRHNLHWALGIESSPIDYQFCILICPSWQCIEIEPNKVTSSVSHCLFLPVPVAPIASFVPFARLPWQLSGGGGGSPRLNVCDVSGLK